MHTTTTATANTNTAPAQPGSDIPAGDEAFGHTGHNTLPDAAAREGSSWPFRPEDECPLAWWRTVPADILRDAEQLLLRDTLSKIDVLKGCQWLAAMKGDDAASVAVAYEVLPIGEIALEVDLALTVLMLSALGGSAGAAVVLSEALRRASLDHPFAKELSVSWLALNRRRAIDASQHRLHNCRRPLAAIDTGIDRGLLGRDA